MEIIFFCNSAVRRNSEELRIIKSQIPDKHNQKEAKPKGNCRGTITKNSLGYTYWLEDQILYNFQTEQGQHLGQKCRQII